MRYLLPVLVLAAMALTPSLVVAGGVGGGACPFGGRTTTAQQEIKGKQVVQTSQAEQGDKQVRVTEKTK